MIDCFNNWNIKSETGFYDCVYNCFAGQRRVFAGKSKSKMAAGHRVKCVTLSFFLILDEILADNEMYFHDELDPSAFLLLQSSRFCRNTAVRIHGFAETTVPRYSDPTFGTHFRMQRSTAEILVQLLGNCPEIPIVHERGRP